MTPPTSADGSPGGRQFGSYSAQPGGIVFPRRFYREVTVVPEDNGFAVRLDGRGARTPGRHALLLPTEAGAAAVAAEWADVESVIDPRNMPLTRLVNSVIDGVRQSQADVLAEVIRFGSSDLIVYRVSEPERLARAQAAAWDPIVAWSRDVLQAPLVLGEGVMFVPQPAPTLRRLSRVTEAVVGAGDAAPFRLGALHVMTTLTGSHLLALAVAAERLSTNDAWAAAHVDEDFQIGEWGEDAEAAARRSTRETEMRAAAALYTLSRSDVDLHSLLNS